VLVTERPLYAVPPGAAEYTPVDPSPAVDHVGVIVKMTLPAPAPSIKERKAFILKQARKQKPGFKPNSTSAWEEVFIARQSDEEACLEN
jgi:hypothetical protein